MCLILRVELEHVGFQLIAQACLTLVNSLGIRVLMLVVVTTRVLTLGGVEAHNIFPALGLFYVLRGSFFSRVSMALQFAGQGYTTIKRIQVCRTMKLSRNFRLLVNCTVM